MGLWPFDPRNFIRIHQSVPLISKITKINQTVQFNTIAMSRKKLNNDFDCRRRGINL